MGKTGEAKWHITVKTGDHKGSGTDSNVSVAFIDKNGKKSKDIKLDVKFHNDFKRGQEDTYTCDNLINSKELDDIPCTLELVKDDAGALNTRKWYCELVTLKVAETEILHFPVLRWVEDNYRYKFPVNDTSLPQDDKFADQRKRQLEISRDKYRLGLNLDDTTLPTALEALPPEEEFSDETLRDINLSRYKTAPGLLVGSIKGAFKEFESYKDVDELYMREISYKKPRCSNFWESDEWFGAQRLKGLVTLSIKLCTKIPENFGVTNDLVQDFLEGMTLDEALKNNKLFIIDYGLLDGVIPRDGYYVCTPLALFFVNKDKKLMPVAIQLFQDKHNPVFTPGDDRYKWTLAKLWFNHMDSTFHQPCFHLGFTHLAMEGIAVAVHRCLAKNHPLFRLLAPHFLYLFAIKFRGLDKLISEDGYFNQVLGIGRDGGFQLLSRLWADWTLDVTGTLPADLKSRGVDDPSILPEFPYRDDGMLVYNAIFAYVANIVGIYYGSDKLIQEDVELQNWGRVLSTSAEEGGAGIKGVPNGGVFKTKEDIINVCTSIIFTCSAQHAAMNFAQYEEYGYPLNYPSILKGQPPKDKSKIEEEDVVAHLEEHKTIYNALSLATVLSTKSTNSLGNWEIRWQYDPRAIEVEKSFRENLKKASAEIKKRNLERSDVYKYTVLDPENIPNAISI